MFRSWLHIKEIEVCRSYSLWHPPLLWLPAGYNKRVVSAQKTTTLCVHRAQMLASVWRSCSLEKSYDGGATVVPLQIAFGSMFLFGCLHHVDVCGHISAHLPTVKTISSSIESPPLWAWHFHVFSPTMSSLISSCVPSTGAEPGTQNRKKVIINVTTCQRENINRVISLVSYLDLLHIAWILQEVYL